MTRFVGTYEIAQLLGVSRQRAHQIVGRKGFPDPVAELAAGRVWKLAAVEKWIKVNRPDGPQPTWIYDNSNVMESSDA